MAYDNNFSGTTKLRDWWSKVKANFTYLYDMVTDLNTTLDNIVADAGSNNTEIVDARGSSTTLRDRLDDSDDEIDDINADILNRLTIEDIRSLVGFSDINKNLSKIDNTMIDDTLLQMIAGTAAINAVPADGSLTTAKYANLSMDYGKMATNILDKIANGIISDDNLVYNRPFYSYICRRNSEAEVSNATDYFRTDVSGNIEVYATYANTVAFTDTANTLDTTKKIEVCFDLVIDAAVTFGALIGFCKTDAYSGAERVLVGYEPAHSAIELYDGATGLFYKIIDAPTTGTYRFRLVYNSTSSLDIYIDDVLYPSSDYVTLNMDIRYFRVNCKLANLGLAVKNISVKELDATLEDSAKQYNAYGQLSGENVHIYEFGGQGNDYCFVRTPAIYDPQGEPCEFVICNHGNGWTMNGTEAKANWTEKTQFGVDTQNSGAYLDTGDPLYKQYSNHTIETLLNAGYVVCGAQNYADALYGNEDCRQACADFYFHMIRNYNVKEQCFMIGASNGAMTSLNALWLLGAERIKAIILQYPLACLWEHYTNYSAHQAAIESAYSISSGLTEEQFLAATRTHDPEKAGTVEISGTRYKTVKVPPIKIWWSATDTVTAAANNTTPLLAVLEASNLVNDDVQIDAGGGTMQHGDYRHFDHAEYLAWFERWK